MRVWPGNSYPLGATWDGKGVNFALFSEHATKVELCLFEALDVDKETAGGDLIGDVDEHGEPIVGDTVLLLLNAHHEAIPFTLPVAREGQAWERCLDTADPQG